MKRKNSKANSQAQLAVRCSVLFDGLHRLWLRLGIFRLKCHYLQVECRYGQLVHPFFKLSAFRFLLIRFYLFAYGKNVPADFRWGRFFGNKTVNQVEMVDDVHRRRGEDVSANDGRKDQKEL